MEEQGPGEIWGELPTAEAPAATVAFDKRGEEISDFVFHAQNRAEDIAHVQDMGFEVDDDNEPAPKNVPTLFGAPAPVRGGTTLKDRHGDGTASIAEQSCKARCTTDQHLQISGPLMRSCSLTSLSTSSP